PGPEPAPGDAVAVESGRRRGRGRRTRGHRVARPGRPRGRRAVQRAASARVDRDGARPADRPAPAGRAHDVPRRLAPGGGARSARRPQPRPRDDHRHGAARSQPRRPLRRPPGRARRRARAQRRLSRGGTHPGDCPRGVRDRQPGDRRPDVGAAAHAAAGAASDPRGGASRLCSERVRIPSHSQLIAGGGPCRKAPVGVHTSAMLPRDTSIFALPDHRPAKADPALIAADERHFATLSRALAEKVAGLTTRLDARRRDPAGSGAQTIERDADIRRMAAELSTLRRFGLDLCIGHFATAAEPDPVYVGRIGLLDSSGTPLLVDWRTPAAEPFFAATLADPMGVTYRRRYRWSGGRIVDFWDEVLGDDGDPASRASLDEQSAFLSSLGGARTGRMRDVLATIQSDQDAIIRADARGALVVDGGPGTGKTVVALHRAAYLLHADSRIGRRRGNLLLVGPHRPYLDYVADVLPALGEHSVQTATIADLAGTGGTGGADPVPDEPDAEVSRLKSTTAMVDAIETAVRFYEQP